MVLGVPILKYLRVCSYLSELASVVAYAIIRFNKSHYLSKLLQGI